MSDYLSFMLAGAALLALAGCQPSDDKAASQDQGMRPASVSIQVMRRETVPFAIELPATLSGFKEVEIRARVAGILESRNFGEGAKVNAGESLFTLDMKPFEVAVSAAEADLQAAEARLAQAEREVSRLRPLRDKNSVSQRELDDAISAQEVAQADLESAKAGLDQARLEREYAQVKSPVTGIAGRELASEGTYVSGPDLLLTNVTQLDPIRVRFGLSERLQLQMRQDAAAGKLTLPQDNHWQTRVKLPDGTFHDQIGEVNFSDVRINPNTGTSELQALVPNGDFALRPGQFVRVVLEGAERHDAYVVPQRAVMDSGTGKFVYVAAKNEQGMTVARPAPIEVGEWVRRESDAGVQNGWVIRSGLNDGDRVVIDGMARIFFPGMPIQVTNGSAAGQE
ncbi:efflux RND transporter periplasmic adaptor subunit [Saliniradius amylolyticus]|nr:efflux RND transporter periplasmic adaptor subunit [Saliniradius amylolyticus]